MKRTGPLGGHMVLSCLKQNQSNSCISVKEWYMRISTLQGTSESRKPSRIPYETTMGASVLGEFLADPKHIVAKEPSEDIIDYPEFLHNRKLSLGLDSWSYPERFLKLHDAQLVGESRPSHHLGVGVREALQKSIRVERIEDAREPRAWRKLSNDEVLEELDRVIHRGTVVTADYLYQLVKECIVRKDSILGRRVHGLVISSGFEVNPFLANHLIRMYASCGSLLEANRVFSKLQKPDRFAWVSIMLAHVECGQAEHALKLYHKLRDVAVEPNDYIFVAALKACASARNLRCGKLVHSDVRKKGLESNIFVGNSLVGMYSKCESLSDARRVFDRLPTKDVVTWNAMIGGYVQHGLAREALELYVLMQQDGMTADKVTFVGLLKACGSIGSLKDGKQIHVQVLERNLEADPCLGNTLIDMYSKCGSLVDAQKVFDGLKTKDVISWNAMIGAYSQHGFGQEALDLHARMQQNGITADNVTYASILKACSNLGALQAGKQIHAKILETGHEADTFVENTLVHMYAACGSLVDARAVFDGLSKRDVVTWNAMIAAYAEAGLGENALELYESMRKTGIVPDNVTLVSILKACGSVHALEEGKQIHAVVREGGFGGDEHIQSSLIDMYVKCGSLKEARTMFDKLPNKGMVTWSAMITGYSENGLGLEALELFSKMSQDGVRPDEALFVGILKACSSIGALQQGKRVHAQILEREFDRDVFVGNAIVDMYVKCGSLDDARSVFDIMPTKDLITWSVIISGYAQHGHGQEALNLYARMQQQGLAADKVLFVGTLKACSSIKAIQEGKRIHAQILKLGLEADTFVGSALVDMYAKCGSLENARDVFDRVTSRNVVTWSAMIAGYGQHGLGQEALDLYAMMQQDGLTPANSVTFLCLLKACSSIGALQKGKQIHAQIQKSEVEVDGVIGNTLLDMYVKCGSLEDAHVVFDSLHHKDVVTWSTLIAGCVQHGSCDKALKLFENMQHEGVTPNEVTFVHVVKACGIVGAILEGRRIHSKIIERCLETDLCVGNALVDMYGKWGCLDDAQAVFDRLSKRDVVSWTALINGYGQQNNCRKAIQCFDEMKLQGVEPNATTFTALLVACSHVAMVDEGTHYLKIMAEEHSIIPAIEHYTCVADLLGRSGRLNAAEDLLLSMPYEHDRVGWMSLLTACKAHGNVQLGRRCFDHLLQMGLSEASGYVLMSNIYTDAGRGKDAAEIENLRRSAGFSKKAAKATIEVNNKVFEFLVGGRRDDTSVKLKNLNLKAAEEETLSGKLGTMPITEEDALCAHAEKLALAFGLLNTPEGTTLLINKNLRMCNHCHSGTKIVSKIEKREIIIRDAHRVHHFVDGSCSCGDHF